MKQSITAQPSLPASILCNNPREDLSCCITHTPLTSTKLLLPASILNLSFSSDSQSSSCSPEKTVNRTLNNPPKNYSYYFSDNDNGEDDEDYCCLLEDDDDLLNSDSDLEYLSSCSDPEDLEDLDLFDSSAVVEDCCNPFWFDNEEIEHMEIIFQEYNKQLVSPDEFMRSVQPFVGRIERTKACSDANVFQTFDCVAVGNCQRVPLGNSIPILREEFCLTTWDCDGIPIDILTLNQEQISFWSRKLASVPSSFLYKSPEYSGIQEAATSKYQCSSSAKYKNITYSGLPFQGTFTPYVRRQSFSLPSHLKETECFV